MSEDGQVQIFGIRHLSAAGAWHLRAFLDRLRPTAVLVEGPAEADELAAQLSLPGVVPPVALLAYTEELPVRTLLYPFAAYSPEYEAFRWARQHGAEARFIDLPAAVSLALMERRQPRGGEAGGDKAPDGSIPTAPAAPEKSGEARAVAPETVGGGPGEAGASDADLPQDGGNAASGGDSDETGEASSGGGASAPSPEPSPESSPPQPPLRTELYERIAAQAGEPDYESYWERAFEHTRRPEAYREAIRLYSASARELTEPEEWRDAPGEAAYNEIREAYMRRSIAAAIRDGHAPGKIVVLVGAHHVSGLSESLAPMGDREAAALPRLPVKHTLMPYSYYKLSTLSGYGAGNQAPAYYELLWQCLQRGRPEELPERYLSGVAASLRDQGQPRSTAAVIEGVRLAAALAALRGASRPTWRDLRDAAITVFGYGEFAPIAEALARADIGTTIGRLPEGVSQTPVQDDLNRQLKRLKLEKYKSLVAQTLELDLRENRRVKSEEAAYLDLNRSVLLHRLETLGIGFARKQPVRQDSATWQERWVLQWTPEAEIQAVESTLKGETVELAAGYVLQERLEACERVAEASKLIRLACDCGLPRLMEAARAAVQELAVDDGELLQIAAAAYELSVLIGYGSLRRLETDSLLPLLAQLFLRGTLLLQDAAACNDDAAQGVAEAIQTLQTVARQHDETVDAAGWRQRLGELAARDDRNAKLSGLAFALLLEEGAVTEEQCAREVSRRLSPGIPADLGAGWFEGLALRNRYALLSRDFLWRQLDDYIQSLEEEAFRRSLVFLRRAFRRFEPREKASIAERMGELWGLGAIDTGSLLQEPLSDEEKGKLDELNDFDFGEW